MKKNMGSIDKIIRLIIAAVIGVALIAFGEDIGQEMCMRTMNHLLQYGEPIIRRTVPLAMGLLRISHPEI